MSTPTPPLTLYVDSYWISPYVFSAFVALTEKGVPFETRSLHLPGKDHHAPEYRDRSLTGRVPTLVHGDFWLAESSAIAEYLEEIFPTPRYPRLFPEDVQKRARARQVMAWVRSDLGALRDERPANTIFFQPAEASLSPTAVHDVSRLERAASILVPDGATTMFGAWSLADSELAFMLHRLIRNGHDIGPKLKAFAEAQWARPAVRAFVERERQPYPV